MTTANAAAEIIATFRATVQEIEATLAPKGFATLTSHNWIVIDEYELALDFTVTPEGRGQHRATVTGKRSAHKVSRFTQDNAETLAAALNGRAVLWMDAARKEAEQLRQHIATIEALNA